VRVLGVQSGVVVVVVLVVGEWAHTGAVCGAAVSSGMYDTCHTGMFDRTVSAAGSSGGHRPAKGHTPLGILCRSVSILFFDWGPDTLLVFLVL
jgi:hypothetical protein